MTQPLQYSWNKREFLIPNQQNNHKHSIVVSGLNLSHECGWSQIRICQRYDPPQQSFPVVLSSKCSAQPVWLLWWSSGSQWYGWGYLRLCWCKRNNQVFSESNYRMLKMFFLSASTTLQHQVDGVNWSAKVVLTLLFEKKKKNFLTW